MQTTIDPTLAAVREALAQPARPDVLRLIEQGKALEATRH
jgi:hypothetical protein